MTLSTKLVIAGTTALLAAIGAGLFVIHQKDQRIQELVKAYQANTADQFETLAENAARSDNIYLESQELMSAQLQLISGVSDQIAQLLEQENIEPTTITHTEGRVEGDTIVVQVGGLSDIPRKFQFVTADGMPVAFYNIVSVEGGLEMETGVYDIYVTANHVVAFDSDGTPTVVTEATIASSADPDTEYPINITSSTSWFAQTNENELHWWDPHLEIGTGGSYEIPSQTFSAYGDLAVSVISYGNLERDIMRFLRLGIGANNNTAYLAISPVEYNIGDITPLLEDTWIYPTIVWAPWGGEHGIGIGVSSTL